MIVEKQEGAPPPSEPTAARQQLPWLRILISLALSLFGLWFVTRGVDLSEVPVAIAGSKLHFVLLALAIIVFTMAAKAWRWRLMFAPIEEAPQFGQAFWALALGQFINTAVPFLRLGEIARVYDLGERAQQSKARALGTLLVEKVLDLIMLIITLAVLIPFLVIPGFVSQSGYVMAIAGGVALLILIGLALRNDLAIRLARIVLSPLPEKLNKRIMDIVVAGLHGLAALRSGRLLFLLLLSSAIVAILAVLTPWVLFLALDVPLGLVAAAAIHVVLTVGTLPPSTPARVGVFEFLVAFMLHFFDIENSALILAYTIVYHLVVVIPQLTLGGFAALRRGKLSYE